MPNAANANAQAAFALIDANGVPRKALVPQNFAVQALNLVLATPNTSPGGNPTQPQWTKVTPAHMSGVGNVLTRDAGTAAGNVLLLDADGNATSARAALLLGSGFTGVFNVKHYGAKGDDATDDTAAINAAVTALNAAGGGVLFFPFGRYRTSGGHTFTVAARVEGSGQGYWHSLAAVQVYYNGTHYLSVVKCTSATADLFHFSGGFGQAENIILHNIAASRPTAGSALCFQGPNEAARAVVHKVTCLGFYIPINHRVGAYSHIDSVIVADFVKWGIRMANEANADWGDCVIDNIFVQGGDATASPSGVPADAGVRWESGGGLKGSNWKFVDAGILHAISIEPQAGVHTSQIIINNVSCDQIAGNGIRITTAGDGTINYLEFSNFFIESAASAYAPIYIGPAVNGAVGPVLVNNSLLIAANTLTHNYGIEIPANSGVVCIAGGNARGGHADTTFNAAGFTGNTLIEIGNTDGVAGNVNIGGGIVSGTAVGGWFGMWAGVAAPGGSDFALLQNNARTTTVLNSSAITSIRVGNVSQMDAGPDYVQCQTSFYPPTATASPRSDRVLAVDGSGNLVFAKGGVWKTVTLT